MSAVYITHTATFMPNDPVGNDDMEKVLGRVCDKSSRARRAVLRSNGIVARHYAIDPDTGASTHTNAELTANAIRMLEDPEFRVDEMECLVCGTAQADQIMPNHAVMVHGELGTTPCEVVGTTGICVAGMTAMKYAYLGVASNEFQRAVATGSETASAVMRSTHFDAEVESKIAAMEQRPEIAFEKDFLRWMLSDGAGAALLQNRPREQGLSLRVDWIFERSYASEMDVCMYSGAEKLPTGKLQSWKDFPQHEWLTQSIFSVKQDVKQLNEHVIHYTLEKPLLELCERKAIKPSDFDHFLPHYSSEFFRQKVFDGLCEVNFKIPFDLWFTNLTSKGNTGSAAIYIMLDELYRSGRLQKGERLLCWIPESGRFSSAFMQLTVAGDE